uniref:Uncharacterized protein n=1 Tax=Oryza punctata TaxID=4537 RepID=A0A0E0LHC0_ORYPU
MAQHAYFQFNIQALQVQKKVLRAMEQKMNVELDNLLQATIACRSRLGAGLLTSPSLTDEAQPNPPDASLRF